MAHANACCIYTIRLAVTNVFGHITDKRTPSRPLGEVKLRRAGPVVRWVTTREAPVLKAQFFLICMQSILLCQYYFYVVHLHPCHAYNIYVLNCCTFILHKQ